MRDSHVLFMVELGSRWQATNFEPTVLRLSNVSVRHKLSNLSSSLVLFNLNLDI